MTDDDKHMKKQIVELKDFEAKFDNYTLDQTNYTQILKESDPLSSQYSNLNH